MKTDIYISNISEDVWNFIETLSEKEKAFEIEENAYLSDREMLTLNPKSKSIIIFPEKIDPVFIEYYQKLFNNGSVEVWRTQHHSGQICTDILQDKDLWQKLVKEGKSNTLVLKSYSSSPQFYELVIALQEEGCKIILPESPNPTKKNVVDYFGSKSGIRETIAKLDSEKKRRWMAKGQVVQTVQDAITVASRFYTEFGGVVIKTNKAHSGAGVVIVVPNSIQGNVIGYFKNIFTKEKYWAMFPIVIEEFLTLDARVGGGNPNCEFMIDEFGKLHLLYICGMRISAEGVFKGVEINNYLFDSRIKNRLLEYGKTLGDIYSDAGYKGYYDVDCMYTTDEQLLITESNVRKTGGTHVYHTGNLLLGSQFGDHYYLLSNNTHPLPEGKQYTFSQLLQKLEPLLYSKITNEGVVLASANILKQQKISHVIIGKDKESAYALEHRMEQLLAE